MWKVIPNDPNIKAKIAEVSGLLEQLVRMAKGSNASGDHAALTDIERASLIAVLETALAVLKSPHAEKGLLQKLKDMLGKTAKQAAEKETEEAFGTAADLAKNALGGVIKSLFS